ncbi:MAG: hypothetical protein R3F46_12880 [bacterium]
MRTEWTPPEDFTSPPIDEPDVWIAKMAEVVRLIKGRTITDAKVGIWFFDEKHLTADISYLDSPDLFKGRDDVKLNLSFSVEDDKQIDCSFGRKSGTDGSVWLETFGRALPFAKIPEHARHVVSGDESRLEEFFDYHRVFSLMDSQFDWLIGTSIEKVEMIRWKEIPSYPNGLVLHFSNRKLLSICGWEGDEFDLLPYFEKPGWLDWEVVLVPIQ